jgi:hypothetical protein
MTRLLTPRFFSTATLFLGLLATWFSGAGSAHAQQACQTLRYTFQPDCLQSPNHPGACPAVIYLPSTTDPSKDSKSVDRLDLGPQIAVWIESADRSVFVDTLMVTNQVAARGIGNRPGLSYFVSSPKFPYGKRQMALPIWAHSRGKLYPTVVFQDLDTAGHSGACSGEARIGFHENCSSPEPFYCRPLMPTEFVDAITCPSALFNSSKGRFDMTLPKSYYPPRSDLGSNPAKFISQDCDLVFDTVPNCTVDSEKYAADPNVGNDLDAVAQATPPYGAPYSGTWAIPPMLAAGDYAVWVEVNKEFDSNGNHNQSTHPSVFDNQGLSSYGMAGNFGQPSVVYRAPIRLDDVTDNATGSAEHIQGYSDWTGGTGTIIPPDATITTGVPGSGEGRLLELSGPAGTGRVLVSLENCSPVVCDPPPPTPGMVSNLRVLKEETTAISAIVRFKNAGAAGQPVGGYEIRYLATNDSSLTPDEFSQATRASQVMPGLPGSDGLLVLENLKPSQHYVIGIRSQGPCNGQSDIAMVDFTTPSQKFTQLSGCFVATAAYGSEMEPQVAALRSLRDSLRPKSGLVAAAVDLYYRSGPAAAAVIARSDTARTLARRLLAPAAELAEAAVRAQHATALITR